jgi:hypothetical protein
MAFADQWTSVTLDGGPDRNIYGCTPCPVPTCRSVHRYPKDNLDSRLTLVVRCDDCGLVQHATYLDVDEEINDG